MIRRLLSVVPAAMLCAVLAVPAFASTAPDIVKLKRDVVISKEMTVNNAVVVYGSATVYGRVDGALVVVCGSAYLKGDARVIGDLVVIGGEIVREPTAYASGKVTHIPLPCSIPSLASWLKGPWLALWAAISILALIGFLGLAVVIIALVPGHMGAMTSALDRSFGAMFLRGLLGSMLVVPVALLLAISIVGIILIPLEIVLAALAFMVGYIASAAYIGKRVFRSLKRTPPPFADALLGIVILYAAGFVPVIGAAIKAVFLIAGFGAVIMTRFGTAEGR